MLDQEFELGQLIKNMGNEYIVEDEDEYEMNE